MLFRSNDTATTEIYSLFHRDIVPHLWIGLGHSLGGRSGLCFARHVSGGQVYYYSASSVHHMRQHSLAGKEGGGHVEVHHSLPLFFGGVGNLDHINLSQFSLSHSSKG